MEYANGGTLRRYLKNNFVKLTWDDKYKLAHQLASAVSCLHSEGIVHRDLVIYFTYSIIRLLLIMIINRLFNYLPKIYSRLLLNLNI